MISSSGCNVVPIEMAEQFQKRGVNGGRDHQPAAFRGEPSKHADGKKLQDFADLVLDTGAPAGDAMVKIEGLDTPVSPGSTVGGCMLVNAIKAEVAARLTAAGQPPQGADRRRCWSGAKARRELFEAAYDEHARRLAKLYEKLGRTTDHERATPAHHRHRQLSVSRLAGVRVRSTSINSARPIGPRCRTMR